MPRSSCASSMRRSRRDDYGRHRNDAFNQDIDVMSPTGPQNSPQRQPQHELPPAPVASDAAPSDGVPSDAVPSDAAPSDGAPPDALQSGDDYRADSITVLRGLD